MKKTVNWKAETLKVGIGYLQAREVKTTRGSGLGSRVSSLGLRVYGFGCGLFLGYARNQGEVGSYSLANERTQSP